MAQIFPKWADEIPRRLLVGAIVFLTAIVAGVWYFFSPEYTDVGYAPQQPVDYSHKIHAGQLGLDCQYCHTEVFNSKQANVPPTQTCMNCHSQIDSQRPEEIQKIRDSWNSGEPIEWVRVHNLPDYAYFSHEAHVNVGVGCESCHGRVDKMDVVSQQEPLSMSWCLDCHRNPEQHLRPVEEVTTMGYQVENQVELGKKLIAKHNVHPPTYCQGCHY
ncbi:cytochrome c family protein [Aliifodinibius sp. S!AR15-10]|uniref:cytochrome c3 family protein n=1 Tax=Aliifodinibius sp. S!AR15-10 TaxID=2950437 RepID=UPI00285B1BA9|nr:cytochrome c3 family protein [Aliifodinibius sp. S!AR15-10]MDR8393219.1 cytochrome c family protein [Aliifodinibius sp. S!AR15-10]